jgi:hypothetical protein
MHARCKGQSSQKAYLNRGITVCSEWKTFANFLRDMGVRPEGTTLDRIDVNGNYEPGNCRWATATQQAQNKTDNLTITLNGETLCVTEWARRLGMKSMTIRRRLWNGWPPEDALSTAMYHHMKGQRQGKQLPTSKQKEHQ